MDENLFTSRLWSQIEEPIVAKILAHPFIMGLADGSLDEEIFKDYIIQDHKYLNVFGRTLSMLAAKAPKLAWSKEFAESALAVVSVESHLHEDLMAKWGLDVSQLDAFPMQPACMLYTSYVQAVAASKPFHEGVAAVLACYWIYQHVGQHLKKLGSRSAVYQKWIDTYGGAEFDASVQRVLALVNELEGRLHEDDKEIFAQHFYTTARFEYMFWDGPWRRETWPI